MATLGRNYSGPELDAEQDAVGVLNMSSSAKLDTTRYIRVRIPSH